MLLNALLRVTRFRATQNRATQNHVNQNHVNQEGNVMKIPAFRSPLFLGSAALLLAGIAAVAYPTLSQNGLIINKPGAQPGYVIFGAPDGFAYAISADGKVARKWSSSDPRLDLGYTRPNASGTLLSRVSPSKNPAAATADQYGETLPANSVIEMSQDGQTIWKYSDPQRGLHHDMERMDNGNTLLVCSKDLNIPAISKQTIQDDCVIEVDKSGKVVWEWQTSDHFDDLELSPAAKEKIMTGHPVAGQGTGGQALAVGAPPVHKAYDWAHMNSASFIPKDAGLTDPRFKAGNIIVSFRHLNTVAVIDRDSKKIVWKIVGMTLGQHNAHMIATGLPGAGHILIYDNGNNTIGDNPRGTEGRFYSRIVEVDPVTSKIVWEYTAEKSNRPIWTFFSHYISSAQRQPNGNTLVCEGANGRFFEVTPAGEIVWEYVNPFASTAKKVSDNTVFRVAKVPETWLKK